MNNLLRIVAAWWCLGLCSCSQLTTSLETSSAPTPADDDNRAIEELRSRLWDAVHGKSADEFVDCYFIESRFDTRDVREASGRQIEILLSGDIIDIEVEDIPEEELAEIMKIQNAEPATAIRYSLMPRKMLWVRQRVENGTTGRGFLIGERDGKWHIITLAGHTT